MSMSIIEYSSDEQSRIVINISIFYTGLIVYSIFLVVLLMITSFYLKKKMDNEINIKINTLAIKVDDSIDFVNNTLIEEINKVENEISISLTKYASVNDVLQKKIDGLKNDLIKLKEEQYESLIYFNKELDKVRNALSSKLLDVNTSSKCINIRIDTVSDLLQKKIDNVNDKTLKNVVFKQEEFVNHFKNELDKVKKSLLSKFFIDINNLQKETNKRIDSVNNRTLSEIKLKEEYIKEYTNKECIALKKLQSKIDYDKAFGLYQECPDKLEAMNYLTILKNIDRKREDTFNNVITNSMNKFSVMTVKRDHKIVDIIKFFIQNKIKARAPQYGPLVFDFSKELGQIKTDIITTYPFSDEDKKWLNVNVFQKL